MEKNEMGQVNYNTFVCYLNWRDHPVTLPQYTPAPAKLDAWTGNRENKDAVQRVNYGQLLGVIFNAD